VVTGHEAKPSVTWIWVAQNLQEKEIPLIKQGLRAQAQPCQCTPTKTVCAKQEKQLPYQAYTQ